MTAYNHAQQLYTTFPDIGRLDTDILRYAMYHYAYLSPECIILARPMVDTWFVYLAVGDGCLARFFELAPFVLPFVSFERPAKGLTASRKYPYERIKQLCLSQSTTSLSQ